MSCARHSHTGPACQECHVEQMADTRPYEVRAAEREAQERDRRPVDVSERVHSLANALTIAQGQIADLEERLAALNTVVDSMRARMP